MRKLRLGISSIALFLCAIWITGLVDIFAFHGHLRSYGIVPRTELGLRGILFAPFLHEGYGHLMANSGGILVFGGLIVLRQQSHFWAVTFIGALASGGGTWLLGRPAVHIGASGIVFAYFGYLLCIGWFERRFSSLLFSVVTFLVWGPTLYGVLPVKPSISWEGHLFGLIGGYLAASILARRPKGRRK